MPLVDFLPIANRGCISILPFGGKSGLLDGQKGIFRQFIDKRGGGVPIYLVGFAVGCGLRVWGNTDVHARWQLADRKCAI